MPDSMVAFSESELFEAFRRVLNEDDAHRMAAVCAASSTGACDYTLDTLLVLSLHSPEFDARARAIYGLFPVGQSKDPKREEMWARRRAILKSTIWR